MTITELRRQADLLVARAERAASANRGLKAEFAEAVAKGGAPSAKLAAKGECNLTHHRGLKGEFSEFAAEARAFLDAEAAWYEEFA